MDTAANWHYIPAVVDGDLATTWTTVKIHYQLPQPVPASQPGTTLPPPQAH